MAKVIYERRGEEASLYATAVTYRDNVVRCTTYPSASPWAIRDERMEELEKYGSKEVDIPLSRVVKIER